MADNIENNTEVNEPIEPVEGTEATSQATEQPQERQLSATEQKAAAQGWVPKDQWEGDPDDWVSAREFVRAGELFAKIDEGNRRNKALEGTVQELKKHYKQVRETEYKRALAALKAEKKNALDEGDSSRVVEIDEEIASTKQEAARAMHSIDQPQQMAPAASPVFMVWENRNPWYKEDRAMKVYADLVGDELAYNGMTNPVEILQEVERRVKKEFSHKFTNPNRAKPGAVEGGGNKGGQSRQSFELTAEESQVMKKLVKAGVLTEKEYIADIKAQRGV
jgi:hypothetical protein